MNGEENTQDYKIIGWFFLILAFIVLLSAFIIRGVENFRGARLVLIIIGAMLTVLGGIICSFKKELKKW